MDVATLMQRMHHLDHEYSYSLGALDEDCWYGILDRFQDASVFQTTAFSEVKSRSDHLEHLVLRRGLDPVAAAQIRLIRLPFTGISIAYVFWGPLCHRRGGDCDWAALGQALSVLRREYVERRGMSLRIAPIFAREDGGEWWSVFQNAGYIHTGSRTTSHTIIIDLARSLDELRKGFDKKWRNCLSSSERTELEIREGRQDEMFELFLEMYRDMLARKRIAEPGDIRSFRAMQSILPDRFKMKVFVALQEGAASAGAICSAIGRRGVFLFGATSASGMKNKASYLVQWRVIQWLKQQGCTEYDLHGSNAKSNPGVYSFKMGLCGRNGKEVESAGYFEAHNGRRSQLMLKMADRANQEFRRLQTIYGKYRGFQG